MSLGTSNRDGGKTSESGHLRALAKLVSGDIIEGLAVSQRGAGANMSVDVAIGDAFLRRSDGTYAHPVFNDAVYNQVISAADGSNPRRDLVVLYLDYGVTPSTLVSNNTNNVVKIKVVNGTPAGSPVDPNGAAIQASVGAGNPYTILARVRVPAGQTSISNSLIDDLRTLITSKSATVNTAAIQDSGVTTAKVANSAVTKDKIDLTTFALMRLRATTNTSLSTSAVTVNLATVDLTFGTGLSQSGSSIVIGSGVSRVRVSAVIIADSMSADTYMFSRLRRNRGGTLSEFTSQLQRMASGFVSNSHPPFILDVQSGDIIDLRVDIGAGSGTISNGRPQWLQVEVVG